MLQMLVVLRSMLSERVIMRSYFGRNTIHRTKTTIHPKNRTFAQILVESSTDFIDICSRINHLIHPHHYQKNETSLILFNQKIT